jgi:hypothetical protein
MGVRNTGGKTMNELKQGQIYTLNNGETYDVIHEHFEDGSGSWCYEIVVMKDIIDKETGEVLATGDGGVIDWEDWSIDKMRKEGVLIGEIGKTHFFNPDNAYRLEAIK